jgi:hypothetical protein
VRRSRNQTETPSTQRPGLRWRLRRGERRGRREPQSFFLNHGWTSTLRSRATAEDGRINTDKGKTRIARIDANSVSDNSRTTFRVSEKLRLGHPYRGAWEAHSRQALCSPLSDPCESVPHCGIRGKKSSQKGTMSWDSTAKAQSHNQTFWSAAGSEAPRRFYSVGWRLKAVLPLPSSLRCGAASRSATAVSINWRRSQTAATEQKFWRSGTATRRPSHDDFEGIGRFDLRLRSLASTRAAVLPISDLKVRAP